MAFNNTKGFTSAIKISNWPEYSGTLGNLLYPKEFYSSFKTYLKGSLCCEIYWIPQIVSSTLYKSTATSRAGLIDSIVYFNPKILFLKEGCKEFNNFFKHQKLCV